MTASTSRRPRTRPAGRRARPGVRAAVLAAALWLALGPAAPAQDDTGQNNAGQNNAGQNDAAQDDAGAPTQLGPSSAASDSAASDSAASDSAASDSGAADAAAGGDDRAAASGDDGTGPDGAGTGDADPLAGEGAEGIEVDRLDALDLQTLGTLDAGDGGLGADMWQGTPRRVVEALLPRLPGVAGSPDLRALTLRLLLSSAAPPKRQQAEGGSRDLLQIRIERLSALGAAGELAELIRALPRSADRPGLQRRHVEALFATHRRAQACSAVRAAVAERNAPFWQKALAVCQLAVGQVDQANLTLGLLREQGATDDAAFFRLSDAVARGAQALPAELGRLGPLHLALVEAGGLAVPAARLADAQPLALHALATGTAQSARVRAGAAERAAAQGLLSAETLGARYAAVGFEDARVQALAQREAAAAPADDMPATRRRALLYQALQRAEPPAARADLLNQLLTAPANDGAPGRFLALARLSAPALSQLPVQPELAWFAETAGRALYAAGRPAAAGQWLRMAQQEAIINPKAAAAVTALWPYAKLSGAEEVPANGGLDVWRQAQDGRSAARVAVQQSLLRASLEALGTRPERRWIEIALDHPGEPRPAPAAALLYALEDAGEAGRRGEAVLLALLVLGGPDGLARCHPTALGTALGALTAVGLEDVARRLAVEAAVYNGI